MQTKIKVVLETPILVDSKGTIVVIHPQAEELEKILVKILYPARSQEVKI